MALRPVIVRELRAESRHAPTYWLRVAASAMAVLVVATFWFQPGFGRLGQVNFLFFTLNGILFLAIWLIAPLLTADCISQERRDGTLGLLFLTRLSPSGIAVGKSAVHLIRGFSLLVAIGPVLIVPLLLGGVSRRDLLMAGMLDTGALALSLAAGLIASACGRDWVQVVFVAESISLLMAAGFGCAHVLGLQWVEQTCAGPQRWTFFWHPPGIGPWQSIWTSTFWEWPLLDRLRFMVGVNSGMPISFQGDLPVWSSIWANWPKRAQGAWLELGAGLMAFSLMSLGVGVMVAASRIRHSWRDQPRTLRQERWLAVFCTPRFWKRIFRGRMTRKLNRNPVGWLQQYSWRARLSKWSWCLGVLVAEVWWLSDPSFQTLWTGQYLLGYILLLGLAFAASNSFRQERETGAMELLIVSPLRERQIILGRVFGIWSQFLPAVAILTLASGVLAINAELFSSLSYGWRDQALPALMTGGWFAVPVIGLAISLRIRRPLAGWFLTIGIGLILPVLAVDLILRICAHFWQFYLEVPSLVASSLGDTAFGLAVVAFQLCAGAGAWVMLHRQLTSRRF